MPYKSDSQRRWAHTEAGKKALGGEANVHEWDEATKGKKLPEKVKKSENLTKSVPTPPKLGSTLGSTLSAPQNQPKDISKAGKQNVTAKISKPKKPGDAFAPPSVFFGKSEDFNGPKHPSTRRLWDFITKKHKK